MIGGKLTGTQLGVCTVVALGSFCFGFSGGITGTTLAQPSFQSYFGLDTRSDATAIITAIGIIFYVGCLVGTCLLPIFADKFGRKINLYIYSALLVIAGGLQAGSVNIAMFLASRVLAGIACGALFVSVPLYQSEVAPAGLRGALVACHGTMFCLGSSISQWLNVGFFYVTSGGQVWRPPLAIQCAAPLALFICLRWVPESPRYLVSKGQNEQAREVLARLNATSDGVDEEYVEQEYQAILQMEAKNGDDNSKWSDLIKTRGNRKRTALACFIMFLYPWTGIYSVAIFGTLFMKNLGLSSANQLLVYAGLQTLSPIGNFISGFVLDRIGRKTMIQISLAICSIAMLIQTVVVVAASDVRAGQILGVFALFLFIVGFVTFYDVASFCFCAEIWPQHLRAKGFSLAQSFLWISIILTVGISPIASTNITGYLFLIFVGCMVISSGIIWKYMPETKGVPLEDMGLLFGDAVEGHVDTVVLEGGVTSEKMSVEKV